MKQLRNSLSPIRNLEPSKSNLFNAFVITMHHGFWSGKSFPFSSHIASILAVSLASFPPAVRNKLYTLRSVSLEIRKVYPKKKYVNKKSMMINQMEEVSYFKTKPWPLRRLHRLSFVLHLLFLHPFDGMEEEAGDGWVQLCLGVVLGFAVELSRDAIHCAFSTPLLRPLLPRHSCVWDLGLEHRQGPQRPVLLVELHCLGHRRCLVNELAAVDPVLAGIDLHHASLRLGPVHPPHLAVSKPYLGVVWLGLLRLGSLWLGEQRLTFLT